MTQQTPEEQQDMIAAFDEVNEAAAKSKEKFNAAKDSVTALGTEGSKSVTSLADASKKSASGVSESMEHIRKSASYTGSDMAKTGMLAQDSSRQLSRVAAEMGKIAIATSSAFQNYSKTINEDIKSSTSESMSSIQSIMKNGGANLPSFDILNKLGGGTKEGMTKALMSIKDIAESTEGVENYRTSLMNMASTRGDLKSFFMDVGDNFENLDGFLKNDIATNLKLAESMGITISEVEKLNLAFSQIPGTLGATVDVGTSATKQMTLLEAAVGLARGTGRDYKTVQEDVNKAMNEFGFSAQKAIEYSSRVSEVSRKGNIPLQATKDLLGEISSTYRLYGNNVDAASRMTLKFYDNLRQSGVSMKDSQAMIKGFSDSVMNLSLSQKSFLSSQTGGPGGLLGGLQIEKMLSEGKMDEVFDKVKATIQKQFNGKIMTLGDVKTQEDAAMFTKQRTLLTQGPLGSIVKSDAEASKVLESFKRGEKADPNRPEITKSGMDSLVEPISLGNKIAERSATALTGIDSAMQGMLRVAGVNKGIEGLSTISNGTTLDDSMTAEASKIAVRQQREDSSGDAVTRVMAQKSLTPVPTMTLSDVADTAPALVDRAASTLKNIPTQAVRNIRGENHGEPDKSTVKQQTPRPKAPVVIPVAPVETKPNASSALQEISGVTDSVREQKATGNQGFMERMNQYMTDTFKKASDNVLGKGLSGSVMEKGVEAARETAKTSEANAVTPEAAKPGTASVKTEHTHTIDVVSKGICLDCGKKTQPSTTRLALDPASGL